MAGIRALITEIKAELEEYVREIVRDELRAARNVKSYVLSITYEPTRRWSPTQEGVDRLSNTKIMSLKFMGQDFGKLSWRDLLHTVSDALRKPQYPTYAMNARRAWENTIRFLEDDCGYTCSDQKHEQVDGDKVQTVSITVRVTSAGD